MKKIFTFAAALLASLSMMAETETSPNSSIDKDVNLVGTCYTLPGTYIAGQGGTMAGDMQTKGVKFRTNKDGNTVTFNVNDGYIITAMSGCGQCNDNSKTSTIDSIYVDGSKIEFTAVTLPAKTSSASFSFSGVSATQTIKLFFSGAGTQDNIEYAFTYTADATTKYTVTYMDGETELGIETVKEGEKAVKHGDFERVDNTEFQGWFNDAAFTSTADFSVAITANKTFYGKFIHVASSENLLKELWLSNGVKAYIVRVDSTNIATVKGCYMAGQAAPTVQSNSVSEGATFAQNGNTITVTAENGDTKDYALELTEVTPLSTFTSGEAITFDGTEVEADGYIYSVYGWDVNKGIKWGKPVDDATNLRIREGKNRIYMFLPACDSVAFIGGSGGARDVEIRVNGVVNEVVKTPASGAQIIVKGFNAEAANMVSFESNGKTNGDSGFTGMIIYNGNTPTSINNLEAAKAIKVIENGQIVIIKNGVRYNAVGAKL